MDGVLLLEIKIGNRLYAVPSLQHARWDLFLIVLISLYKKIEYINMKPRDNLFTKYPRYHYNKLGKTKMTFNTIDLAEKYLKKMHLATYTIY